MIQVDINTGELNDILQAINEQTRKTPGLMKGAVNRLARVREQQVLPILQRDPGPPHRPIRWKSARQRRAYFATKGFGRGIPTQRTGALQRGWHYDFDVYADGGVIRVYNSVSYSIFVQGDFAQPFHLDTGWTQAAPVLAEEREIVEDSLINTWHTINATFSGY